jgi:hypothetical protein
MPAWNSSSLAFSDHNTGNTGRHSSGLLKNLTERVSKHITEHKMFGSKRKNIQIGKKFKKIGKGVGKTGSISAKMPKSSGISPSIAQFDKMMSSIVGKKGSKPSFSRKSFG